LPEDYGRAAGVAETVDSGTEDSGDLEPPSVPTTSMKRISPDDLGALVDSYRGKVLLLNCWGIDCGPCVEELPALDKILRDLQPQGLAIVALNTDVESRHGDVEKFVQEKGYSLEFCLRAPGPDTKFRQAIDADYSADPFSVLFDKDGRTLATIADALSEEEWRRILTAAVQGSPLPITQSEYVRYF
jgi:thiol-disulfide isomerase/thioredoxin